MKTEETLRTKPLMEHLMDLRRTLAFCVILILIAFIIILSFFSKELISQISKPILDLDIQIIYTNVSEAFASQLKLSLIVAVIVSSPLILLALWLFIRPALYRSERLIFSLLFICAFVLFISGTVFSYFMVFRLAVNFFVESGTGIATPMLALGQYITFLFSFVIPFGVMFQLPVAIVILTRLGFCTPAILKKSRKYIILIVFILAAVLTPPDIVSQMLLALPILLLFELSVLLSYLVKPRFASSSNVSKTSKKAAR